MVGYFITQVKLHGQWGPRLETSIHRGRTGLPDVLLGSRALMWWVPGMVLGAAFASPSFTWLLSLLTWG
jgi:hypothetical protein